MKAQNVILGVLVISFLSYIFISLIMNSATALNTSGWDSTLVSIFKTYIPLIVGVGVLVWILFQIFNNKKG